MPNGMVSARVSITNHHCQPIRSTVMAAETISNYHIIVQSGCIDEINSGARIVVGESRN